MGSDIQAYFEPVRAIAPALQPWWKGLGADDERSYGWLTLAQALVARQAAGRLPDLAALVPWLETALERDNAGDVVSLGFVEVLLDHAEAAELDTDWIRETLGPRARADWVTLYQERHQDHRVALHWDAADFGSGAGGAAEFSRWQLPIGTLVASGNALATVAVAGEPRMLALAVDAYLDQRVATDGQALAPGCLLGYVLPARGARRPRARPYGRVVSAQEIGAPAV